MAVETIYDDSDRDDEPWTAEELETEVLWLHEEARALFEDRNPFVRVFRSRLMGVTAVIAGKFHLEGARGKIRVASSTLDSGGTVVDVVVSYGYKKQRVELVDGTLDFDSGDVAAVQRLFGRCELMRDALLAATFSDTESALAAMAIAKAYNSKNDAASPAEETTDAN